jgi:hypothetical protein
MAGTGFSGGNDYIIDLIDWLTDPSLFNPLIPFTSGQTFNFPWGVCDNRCFFLFTASDGYPGAFNTTISGDIYAQLLGFKVLNLNMQPYTGPGVTFYSPSLPGIVPEPSTFALCAIAVGGLIRLGEPRRRGRKI